MVNVDKILVHALEKITAVVNMVTVVRLKVTVLAVNQSMVFVIKYKIMKINIE